MSQPFDERADLATWQRRLMPWAITLLVALALFFFASTWMQFNSISTSMQARADDRLSEAFQSYEVGHKNQDLEYLKWKTSVLLERNTVDHRYLQVNATLLLRTWTRHLGFLTGMILAFLGGVFILTKLSETETRLSTESSALKGSLATSSPGIVLTVVGATIMIVTLVVDFTFTTVDTPAYVAPAVAPATKAELGDPLPVLDNAAARAAEANRLFQTEGNQGGETQSTPSANDCRGGARDRSDPGCRAKRVPAGRHLLEPR